MVRWLENWNAQSYSVAYSKEWALNALPAVWQLVPEGFLQLRLTSVPPASNLFLEINGNCHDPLPFGVLLAMRVSRSSEVQLAKTDKKLLSINRIKPTFT